MRSYIRHTGQTSYRGNNKHTYRPLVYLYNACALGTQRDAVSGGIQAIGPSAGNLATGGWY